MLAYLGDSVWELFVRKFYIACDLDRSALQRKVKAMVNAKKQSDFYRKLKSFLDPEYQKYGKKGKNANIKSYPKSCTPLQYREATGFEAIIGSLYIHQNTPMIEELVKKFAEEEM